MKRLFLIGDSIRIGYEPYVREKLAGRAEVLAPAENVRFTQYTLRYLHEWAAKVDKPETVDLVYWNNGLWDALRMFGDEPFTPPEVYGANLARIHARIRRVFPNAGIHFALITPIMEALCLPDMRHTNADVDQFNAVAQGVMAGLGVPVHDLNGVAKAFPAAYFKDKVHYTPEGYACLADAVAAYVSPWLES